MHTKVTGKTKILILFCGCEQDCYFLHFYESRTVPIPQKFETIYMVFVCDHAQESYGHFYETDRTVSLIPLIWKGKK